jgi:hypothetical protein
MIRPKNLPLQTQIAFLRRKMARQGLEWARVLER